MTSPSHEDPNLERSNEFLPYEPAQPGQAALPPSGSSTPAPAPVSQANVRANLWRINIVFLVMIGLAPALWWLGNSVGLGPSALALAFVALLIALPGTIKTFTAAGRASAAMHHGQTQAGAVLPGRVLRGHNIAKLTSDELAGLRSNGKIGLGVLLEVLPPSGRPQTVLSVLPDSIPAPALGSTQLIKMHPTVTGAGLITGEPALGAEDDPRWRKAVLFSPGAMHMMLLSGLGVMAAASLTLILSFF